MLKGRKPVMQQKANISRSICGNTMQSANTHVGSLQMALLSPTPRSGDFQIRIWHQKGTRVFCLILSVQLIIRSHSSFLKQTAFCSSLQDCNLLLPLQEHVSLDKHTLLIQGTHAKG